MEPGDVVRMKHSVPGRDRYTIIEIEGDRAYCSPLHGDIYKWIPLVMLEEIKE